MAARVSLMMLTVEPVPLPCQKQKSKGREIWYPYTPNLQITPEITFLRLAEEGSQAN